MKFSLQTLITLLVLMVLSSSLLGQNYTAPATISFSQIGQNSNFTNVFILVNNATNLIAYTSDSNTITAVEAGNYTGYGVNYDPTETAPNITVGTSFNNIGGGCVDFSNGLALTVREETTSEPSNDTITFNEPATFNFTNTGNNADLVTRYVLVGENGLIQYVADSPSFSDIPDAHYTLYAVNYDNSSTAPNLSINTAFTDIGGECVDVSNAIIILVLPVDNPPVDADGDGVTIAAGDTDDTNPCVPSNHPDWLAQDSNDCDADNVMAAQDCDDMDATKGQIQTAGTACDDGLASTANDQIQADGCTCAGTPIPCFDAGGDSDNDGICDNEDACPNDATNTCNDTIACAAPTSVIVTQRGRRRVELKWAAPSNAQRYRIRIRFQGQNKWVVDAKVRRTKVTIYGPSNRTFEYQIQTICTDGTASEFSEVFEFIIDNNIHTKITAESRTNNHDITTIQIPSEDLVAVFPNPVRDLLSVDFQPTAASQFRIFHISGKIVLEKTLVVDATQHQVDVSALETGYYLCQIVEGNQVVYAHKLVKLSRN